MVSRTQDVTALPRRSRWRGRGAEPNEIAIGMDVRTFVQAVSGLGRSIEAAFDDGGCPLMVKRKGVIDPQVRATGVPRTVDAAHLRQVNLKAVSACVAVEVAAVVGLDREAKPFVVRQRRRPSASSVAAPSGPGRAREVAGLGLSGVPWRSRAVTHPLEGLECGLVSAWQRV